MKISFELDDRIVAVAARVWAIARHRITHALLGLIVLVGAGAVAHADVVLPHTFEPNDPASAKAVNENFEALVTAVNQIQQTLAAKKRETLWLAGSAANRNLAASNNGYFYAHPDRDSWGQIAVALPVGSVITGMACYFYNGSTVPVDFYGEFRELSGREATMRASVEASLVGESGMQKLDAVVNDEGIQVKADAAYFVQFGIRLPSNIADEDYYLPTGDPDDRMLRHYGCSLDYEAPPLAVLQATEGG
ncbi:MAG TPA: hypothetical protein VNN80_20570 [Polyangiaceae bacterium]|nr:hypothetical protein [Polyangiaceae bacterium]